LIYSKSRHVSSEFQSTLPARGATKAAADNEAFAKFQSTLPARGATRRQTAVSPHCTGFNPRSPRGERHPPRHQRLSLCRVSIHAPREGSDVVRACANITDQVSIHAPREGSDARRSAFLPLPRCFNPRSPRGERRTSARGHWGAVGVSIHAPREGSDGTKSR